MKAVIAVLLAATASLCGQQAQNAQSSVFRPQSPVVAPFTPTPTSTMNQIISRMNAQQSQINAATFQNSTQRPIFVPQQITVKPAK